MKKSMLPFSICALIFFTENINAQSFEETTFEGITTTPSASRSANFIDVNGDGWDDIFFTNGPAPGQNNMLYINNGDGTFTTVTDDDIVLDNDRSDGASFADVDNDGDLDAVVVTYGRNGTGKKNYFYRNNGDGTFEYEPDNAIGIPLTYSEMANWIDLNNDQLLDAYITNSVVSTRNLYFANQGDGSFEAVTGLSITNETLASRSINWIDYDGDGDSDLFITNENNANNSLFRNDVPDNFTKITNLSITQSGGNSAGSSWADVDNDGDFDLFIANWNGQNNQLFINENGTFIEQTNSEIALEIGSSFGSAFADVDNDGDLDLLVCNAYYPGQVTNSLFINDGTGVFTKDTTSSLANHQGNTFGCAFGDYNNDGWLDVILANTFDENQSNSLFKNTGSGNNWIKIKCVGNPSNGSAVGAKVKVRATINGNEVWQTRQIEAASGYCSQNSYTNHFGLGDATIVSEIQIQWPSGAVETFNDIDENNTYLVVEGNGIQLKTISAAKFGYVVYPMPADDVLVINFPKDELDSKVEIFDLNGRKVNEQISYAESSINLDVSNLSAGQYILKIINNERVTSQKIIIK
ncbi:FG-GAP-like repeat-containing protein [Aequorivita viscosa]|uniref:Por secretion system C-terminal sorting domain-containing protein n=1 Tax=Aequorivita viscosa TaxID=797419 RepID=A0A1M6D2X9_9FLAO|nr:FG-GAP-like repeat-containing protein [Aequorivita viscosa]SDW43233.1 Por secretion system C-terminal sorting domain-containing protein [Aequorivita viscosa]SHI67358.1 Por secretion system C-terminal sorting domain-containing protein [Aequorivita viscosa]